MTTPWIREYIGLPWVVHQHDCWAFFRKVQRERFGVNVPDISEAVDASKLRDSLEAFQGHGERDNWVEVSQPLDGDAVLMAISKHPSHVGVWIDSGVLHCVKNSGVIFSHGRHLKSMGYNIVGFYRHRSKAC